MYGCVMMYRARASVATLLLANVLALKRAVWFLRDFHVVLNPFVLPNLEPKCAPGDPILYPESIFCYIAGKKSKTTAIISRVKI